MELTTQEACNAAKAKGKTEGLKTPKYGFFKITESQRICHAVFMHLLYKWWTDSINMFLSRIERHRVVHSVHAFRGAPSVC